MSVLGLSWPLDKGQWLPLVAGRPWPRTTTKWWLTRRSVFRLNEHIKLGKDSYTVVGITSEMVSTNGEMAFLSVWDSRGAVRAIPPVSHSAPACGVNDAARRGHLSEPAAADRATRSSRGGVACRHVPELSAVVVRVAPGGEIRPLMAATISTWADVSVFLRRPARGICCCRGWSTSPTTVSGACSRQR